MDDLDEESVKLGGKRSFFTGELAKYRWRSLLPQTDSAEERVTVDFPADFVQKELASRKGVYEVEVVEVK